jgi:hypothetical protein
MRETLLDIVKHTNGLGFIDTVKITGDKKTTVIEAMDSDRTVIIKAKLLAPEGNLIGEFGMSHLPLLQGLLNFVTYKADGASIDVKRRERNGKQVPEEIVFKGANGASPASYRLTAADLIPEQAKFLGSSWDVEISPARAKVQEFAALAGLYSSFENYFLVKTADGNLNFHIGDEGSSMHKAALCIEEGVEGELKGDLYWPITQVLNILKLGLDENVKLQFSGRGALQITMTSAHAEYNYILPARKK